MPPGDLVREPLSEGEEVAGLSAFFGDCSPRTSLGTMMERVVSVEAQRGHWKQWLQRFFLFFASEMGVVSKQWGQK